MKSRALVLIGTAIYVVAWFIPAASWTYPLDGSSQTLYGWQAFLCAVQPDGSLQLYEGGAYVASALSNIALVGALALVLVARRRPPRLLRAILIASAVLNTHWFVFGSIRG